MEECPLELLKNVLWRASMSVTGQTNLNQGPLYSNNKSIKVMIRLPPTCDHKKAKESIKEILAEKNVGFKFIESIPGFNGNPVDREFNERLQYSSRSIFNKDFLYVGTGGSIPFMGILKKTFPWAQFLITGACGTDSSIHGPDESLNLPYAMKFIQFLGIYLSKA